MKCSSLKHMGIVQFERWMEAFSISDQLRRKPV